MDKEQAIEIIERHIDNNIASGSLVGQALSMAIDALKAQLSMEDATSDTISRQQAIDALDCINGVEEVLRSLPTMQPERKTGKWTLGFDNIYMEKYYYCSRCGCRKYGRHEPIDYFCSNCGAKMTISK